MNVIAIEKINEYHSRKIEEWGVCGAKALGYVSDAAQEARFEVISDLFDFNGKSVLDAGCGDGRLKEYLSKRYRNIKYIGIDQQAEFIFYASNKYRNEEKCKFVLGDFSSIELPQSDVVVACGALSYHCEDSEYYSECIEKLFTSAKNAIIFNMLDQSRMLPDEMIVGHDFEQIVKLCHTLTENIVIVRGYLSYEFTLMLLKPQ